MGKIHSTHSEHHVETFTGGREELLKVRASKKKEIDAQIKKFLANYDGSILVLVTADESKDGKGNDIRTLMLGAGNGYTQAAIVKGLDAIQHDLVHHMHDDVPTDPMAALEALLGGAFGPKKSK